MSAGTDPESVFFAFESDFVASLRCIPMAVRLRLDRTGVKLKLNEWAKLGLPDRRTLAERPCGTAAEREAYRKDLSELVARTSGVAPSLLPELPSPLWESPRLPEQVRAQAASQGLAWSDADWERLTTLQRFALIKLSRPGHENHNFLPASREFGLAPAGG